MTCDFMVADRIWILQKEGNQNMDYMYARLIAIYKLSQYIHNANTKIYSLIKIAVKLYEEWKVKYQFIF